MILIVLNLLMFLLIFLLVYFLILRLKETKKENLIAKVSAYLRQVKEGYFAYQRIERYLKSMGNPFDLTPIAYVMGKFLISAILLICFIIAGDYMKSVLAALVGFFLIDILIQMQNKKDMKKIIFELRDVYDLLRIQMASGVFIGSALTEAYLVVSSKRLKKSLAILSAEINVTKNIENALDNFDERFKSVEIANFVMVIKQSLKTGQSKQELNDMSEEISEINLIAIQEKTKKIENTATLISLLIFIGILITALYFTGTEILNNWSNVFS